MPSGLPIRQYDYARYLPLYIYVYVYAYVYMYVFITVICARISLFLAVIIFSYPLGVLSMLHRAIGQNSKAASPLREGRIYLIKVLSHYIGRLMIF
ncbi:hypothetical protein F4810DRAFT_644080 [Camillea tinctor]|nr:hypothetical protein F4810DRAFT_644080 [Camillea tinctor]